MLKKIAVFGLFTFLIGGALLKGVLENAMLNPSGALMWIAMFAIVIIGIPILCKLWDLIFKRR